MVVLLINIVVMGVIGGAWFNSFFVSQDQSQAAFNASTGRFEDVVTSPHQIAEYNYVYTNPSATSATGFFSMVLSNSVGDTPANLFEVVSITDTYPVDSAGNPQAGATVRTMPSASYFFSGNQLNIRFGPQSSCVPRSQGGCNDSTIAPQQPGKISVKLALKTNASTTPSTINGSGQLILTSNSNSSQGSIGWQIQALYQKISSVLNNNSSPTVTFKGANGTGQVFQGQPYSVVVSDIKAVNGANLSSGNGVCSTSRNGQVFTGSGISNGVCVIQVSQAATSILPGGVLTISDRGNPRPIEASYNYSSQAAFANPSSYNASISNIAFNSDRSVYVVNFLTTGFTNGEGGFHTNFYYDTEANSVTNKSTSSSSPYNTAVVNRTSGATQLCVVVARPDNSLISGSGNCVPLPTFETNIVKSALESGDIPPLQFSCETGVQNLDTVCSFDIPPDRFVPNNFFMAVGNAAPGGECEEAGSRVVCEGVPIGGGRGVAQIYAFLSNQSVDTGEVVRIIANNAESIVDDGEVPNSQQDGSSNPTQGNSDNTESGVTTVTINRSTGEGQVSSPVAEENSEENDNQVVEEGDNSEQEAVVDSSTTEEDKGPLSPALNSNGLPSTGGVAFFIVSGLSSLAILSIFSVSLKRSELKINSKK